MSSLDSPVYSHAKKTIYEDQPKKNPPLLRSSSPAQLAPSFEYRTQEMVSNERKRAASTTVGPKAVKREQMSPEKTPTTFTVGTPAPSPTAGVPVTVSGQWNQPSIPVKVVPKQHVTSMDDGPESSFSLTETKLQKTRKHMQELDKEALTACNRALSIYHRPLKRVIASMKLPGLLRLQEYVESYYMYYVLLFSSTELRDQAITQISRTSFSFNERTIRILAHPYGDPKFQPSSIWDVSASLLANSTDIRDAVICYIQLHVPGFETSFTVQEYAEYGYGTGEWAVRLNRRAEPRVLLMYHTIIIDLTQRAMLLLPVMNPTVTKQTFLTIEILTWWILRGWDANGQMRELVETFGQMFYNEGKICGTITLIHREDEGYLTIESDTGDYNFIIA
ncbi:hypothetical protein BZA77DRAFT_291893 [Pyronema omphalodes]|nr:hypothetical protein BZA77DRAFT_296877 [Pyronema omphalodes]KAI5817965.1 hypothetical protein BZA77DRAFT_291893 [Pyronema omphalodes]